MRRGVLLLKLSSFMLAAFFAFSSSASASVLYASNGSDLVRIDPVSGVVSLVGPNNSADVVTDLASSRTTIYGSASVSDADGFLVSSNLDTIDRNTGAVISNISITGFLPLFPGGPTRPRRINTLAYDPTAQILYGTASDRLYTIDPITALVNFIGDASSSSNTSSVFISRSLISLGFDNAGNLFGITQNVTFDSDDNAIPVPGTFFAIDKTNAQIIFSADIPQINANDIAFDPDTNIGYFIGGDGTLQTIDTTTGVTSLAATLSGYAGPNGNFFLNGLTFLPDATVPEPGSIALIGIGLLAIGWRTRRR